MEIERNFTIEYAGGVVVTDEIGYPIRMVTGGVRCGRCEVRHNSAAAVRLCYAIEQDEIATIEEEHRAELATERFFEERGYWEARAQEDHEAAMGVVPMFAS